MGRIKCVWCQGQALKQFRNVMITKLWGSESVLGEQRAKPVSTGATPPFICGWTRRCIHHSINALLPVALWTTAGDTGHVHWPNTLMWAWLRYKTQACRCTQMPEHKHAYLASSSLSRIFDKMHAHAQRNRNVPVWWYCYCQAVLVFPSLNGLTGRVNIKEGFWRKCEWVCGDVFV